MTEPPTNEWAKTVCKIGHGADCCRYIAMSPKGWSCEKHTEMKRIIDYKVAVGNMTAAGDNCEGKGHQP